MRHCVLLLLAAASCTTRNDAAVQTEAPSSETAPACSDVATAPLHLGADTPAPLEGCDPDTIAVAVSQAARWTLKKDALVGGDTTFALGDVSPTDIAAGYGKTAFVLDGKHGAVHRAEGDALTPLTTDEHLVGARAMVRIGGSLFVGTPTGVHRVSLSDGALKSVREGVDVIDLAVDDIGALLVLTQGGLARMLPSGDDAPLTLSTLEARRIAFDLTTTELVAVDQAGTISRIDYSTVVPDGPTSRPATHGDMGTFFESGYILAGAEYWPHRGSTPAKYPEEILWGFYPHEGEVFEGAAASASATPEAVACAEQSYAALRAWIPTATEALAGATAGDKAPRFYLWVNDYSQADDPFPAEMREAKLWYWARNPAVPGRIPGYFKWETVLDQKGECHWPDDTQAKAFLREAAAE